MKIVFSKRCLEFGRLGHPESAQRLERCFDLLKSRDFKFVEAISCLEEDILLVHTKELLKAVRENNFYDPDTPNLENIFEYAKLSAGATLLASQFAQEEGFAFSLMRPPGHHAGRSSLGGFCYFNNIAISVEKIRKTKKKIAIIDFDCHHGNGTEDIFKGKACVCYLSLHQSPFYPGTGLESHDNCFNFPLAAGTGESEYLAVFKQGLEKIKDFRPDILAVSAGFDTYRRDPLGNIKLDKTTYRKIGELIAAFGKPTFAVLEGGYSKDLAYCVSEFLSGMTALKKL
ncbi:MAG: histone deacetylase [Candidatus Omnitrophota bacterium]